MYTPYQSPLLKCDMINPVIWSHHIVTVLTEVRSALAVVLVSVQVSKLLRSDARALSLPVSAGGAGGAQWLPLHTETQSTQSDRVYYCDGYLFMLLLLLFPFPTIWPLTVACCCCPPHPPPEVRRKDWNQFSTLNHHNLGLMKDNKFWIKLRFNKKLWRMISKIIMFYHCCVFKQNNKWSEVVGNWGGSTTLGWWSDSGLRRGWILI